MGTRFSDQRNKLENIWSSLYKVTDDFRLRWLQFRIIHRILPSNHLLQIYGLRNDSTCNRCGRHENIMHIFWSCCRVRRLWRELGQTLRCEIDKSKAILGLSSIHGHIHGNSIGLILLVVRQYIWTNRGSEGQLSFGGLKIFVKTYHSIEKYSAIINGKQDKHDKLWQPIINALVPRGGASP